MTETVFEGESVVETMADAIEKLLEQWPEGQKGAKVTLHMTWAQWSELLETLRPTDGLDVEPGFPQEQP